ncbi:right-handed parallel beta-helix repeat-containing protein [Deinococcus sonorensis]|uniref:Right-handed parallel beta-helix repeat-containing protein n=2 Tax=Deinococcus sonorensis TaxID=309891 RepID=A0AAU7UFY8_9DEIO
MHDLPSPGDQVAGNYTVTAVLHAAPHVAWLQATTSWGGRVLIERFSPPEPDTPTGQRARQAFLRAARALAQVGHPAVARVTDLVDQHQEVYAVVEDHPHQSLGERLKAGPLSPTDLTVCVQQLFAGLGATHAQAALHTAITPEAIAFGEDGQVRLQRFGLSKRALQDIGQKTDDDPRYQAPERLGGGGFTPQTDLYALGAVLFEAASGHVPTTARARAQGVPLPPYPEGVPEAVRTALNAAVALDPAQRAISASEVLERVARSSTPPRVPDAPPAEPEPVAEPVPPSPPTPPPPPVPPPPAPGWRKVAVIAGVSVALLLGLTALWPRTSASTAEAATAPASALEGSTAVADGSSATTADPTPATLVPVALPITVVTAQSLNVRTQPDETSAVSTVVRFGTNLEVLEEQADWLHVRADSVDGWVSRAHTSLLHTPEETAALLTHLAAGGNVTLAAGVYWLDQPLTLTSDVNLVGAGQGASYLLGRSAEDTLVLERANVQLGHLTVGHVGDAFARTVYQVGGNLEASNVVLTGGRRDSEEGAYGSGLWVAEGGHAELTDDLLTANAFGLYVSDDSTVTAKGVSFNGNSDGGALFKDKSGGQISDSRFNANQAHGLHVFGAAHPIITDSVFRQNRGRGITVYGAATPTIAHNTVEDNRLQGVGVQEGAQPTITENTIQGNRQSGLTYFDNSGGEAQNNTIQANRVAGISVTEYAAPTLSGNTVERNGANGIAFSDATTGTAEDNTVRLNDNPGISVWGDAQPQLRGNMVTDNRQSGIVIAEQARPEVVGNTISNNALYGLILTGKAQPTVNENTLEGNGKGGIFYKQMAGGSGYGNTCSDNGGANLSAQLDDGNPGPSFSTDGCSPSY